MNSVYLSGRVGKDPAEAKASKGAHFSMAVTERYKKRGETTWTERTTWLNIQVWGNFADFVMKYIRKGDKVTVHGKISVAEYNNKTYTNIVADIIEPAVFNKDLPPIASPKPEPEQEPPFEDGEGGDEDLPF